MRDTDFVPGNRYKITLRSGDSFAGRYLETNRDGERFFDLRPEFGTTKVKDSDIRTVELTHTRRSAS